MYAISNDGMTDAEFEQYYADLKAMFNSEGWKQLTADAEDEFAVHNSVDLIPANQSLDFHRGYIKALTWLLDRPVSLENEAEERGSKTL